ncbi:MAG: FAD-binding protein, partial [Candidatus Rokubacteria bacterium]|nr:FAD-binding protein [Candidatus Rokubacteria bacterium]
MASEEMLEAFVDAAPAMVNFLGAASPVRLYALDRPDYHPDWPGGKTGGRTLDNEPFDSRILGEFASQVRSGPHFPPLTYRERKQWGSPEQFDWTLIADRIAAGVRTLGGALVAALMKGCLDKGVRFASGVRARRLLRDGDAVKGVDVERGGRRESFRARRGVVLACGGFEWNEAMKRHFLRGPEQGPSSPPWNQGDGIIMGMEVGAALGNMTEAWWVPVIQIPGEEYDGHPLFRYLVDERCRPGAILVNRAGRRFANESTNYNDLGKAFHTFDPSSYQFANLPAFLIFDHRYKRRYPISTVFPTEAAPAWIGRADTLSDLGRALGIDPDQLCATVEEFSKGAREGQDPLFHRGETANDRYYGDPTHQPNPCLGPIDIPPFYGLKVQIGCLGTKGGLLTNGNAEVLHVSGGIIPGLYACGNVMASAMGAGYPGAGGTLGPALTFGYLAGRSAAEPPK